MGKAGRPKGATQYKTEQFINVIPGTGGIITAIARKIGCDWTTAKNFIYNHPTVKAAYDAECEGILDLAEAKLIEQINGGEGWAIKYMLSTKGKSRGYVERTEVTGADGNTLKIEYVNDWRGATEND